MKTRIIIFSLLIVAIFSSCQKDDLSSFNNDCEELLYFENEEMFHSELSKVVNMSLNDLTAYENVKGYISFGRKAWQFYKGVDFESFSSLDEIKDFVKENSDYLELIKDVNGELSVETKFVNRPDRFFLNSNKMYQIGEEVYKVFESGVVKSNTENIDIFYEAGENIEFYKQDERFVFESTEKSASMSYLKSMQLCGTFKEATDQNGDQRLLVEMKVDNTSSTNVKCYLQAKAQKRTIIWVNIDRHFYCNVDIDFTYYDNYYGNGWQTGNLSFVIDGDVHSVLYRDVDASGGNIVGSGDYEPGFTGYSVSVDTDAQGIIGVDWNC